jgi:RNA polymerase sigma-70 factor, ECF subfamily
MRRAVADSSSRAEVEARIRAACDAGDLDRAVTLALEGYGREIFGFLVERLRSEDEAGDVFGDFSVELWHSLAGFEWRCSARAWCYTLARHAASRYRRAPGRRPGRNVPLSAAGLSALEARVRTETLRYLRSETKSRMAELRRQLSPEDQTVLILRIDKELSWKELALIMSYDGLEPTDAALGREAARLRKRFQIAKDALREMAREAGLLS